MKLEKKFYYEIYKQGTLYLSSYIIRKNKNVALNFLKKEYPKTIIKIKEVN